MDLWVTKVDTKTVGETSRERKRSRGKGKANGLWERASSLNYYTSISQHAKESQSEARNDNHEWDPMLVVVAPLDAFNAQLQQQALFHFRLRKFVFFHCFSSFSPFSLFSYAKVRRNFSIELAVIGVNSRHVAADSGGAPFWRGGLGAA